MKVGLQMLDRKYAKQKVCQMVKEKTIAPQQAAVPLIWPRSPVMSPLRLNAVIYAQ
jgi:hypothetical protein